MAIHGVWGRPTISSGHIGADNDDDMELFLYTQFYNRRYFL